MSTLSLSLVCVCVCGCVHMSTSFKCVVYKDVTLVIQEWANVQTADILDSDTFCNFISWHHSATNHNKVVPGQAQHVPGLTQSWIPFCILRYTNSTAVSNSEVQNRLMTQRCNSVT